jgi:hypothetical protein
LEVVSRDGQSRFFVNLNEALTEELTKRFVSQNSHNSLFEKELKQTEKIKKKYCDVVGSNNVPVVDDDTVYATIQDENILQSIKRRLMGVHPDIITQKLSYETERHVLNTIIDKIYKKKKSSFKDREDVFDVFVKSMMTGNIIPIGKLIDSTFGKGTFRRLGELDSTIQEQEDFIASL